MVVAIEPAVRSHILNALPRDELAVIRSSLQPVHIAAGDVIQRAGELIDNVYFVESGVVSLVAPLHEGSGVEVATIGAGGLVGSELIAGNRLSFVQAVGQIEGTALRLAR